MIAGAATCCALLKLDFAGATTATEIGAGVGVKWQQGARIAALCGQQHGMTQDIAGGVAACASHVKGDDRLSSSSNAALNHHCLPKLCTGGVYARTARKRLQETQSSNYRAVSAGRANWVKLNAMKTVLISEIFGPTIQGEGALIGRPTVFVRTGGCDFRCSWCDTLYAVLPAYKGDWIKMDAPAILSEIERLSGGAPITVTLSGGNPALQPLGELLELGHARGHNFALETQASQAPAWLGELDHLVLSPKPPSSQMEFAPETLARCLAVAASGARTTQVSIKVVVFDEADFLFARGVYELHRDVPFYLSVGNDSIVAGHEADNAALTQQLEWLLERCAQEKWFDVTLTPQLHVLLWGNKRGV